MCSDDDAFGCIQMEDETICCSFMYRLLFISWIAPAVFFLKGYVCVFVFSLLILRLISDLIRKTSVLSVIATLQCRLRPFLQLKRIRAFLKNVLFELVWGELSVDLMQLCHL